MRITIGKQSVVLVIGLSLLLCASARLSRAQSVLPNPVPMFIGQEFYETGGKQWTRYRYTIDNLTAYPAALFAAAPGLPPCGINTKAARTWVDIYDQNGRRLNGFCALGNNTDLSKIWFALERDVIPPSYVYIEFTDRATNTKYKSMLSETTQ